MPKLLTNELNEARPWWVSGYLLSVGVLVALGLSLTFGLSWPPTANDVPDVAHLLIPLLVLVVELYMLLRIVQEHRERKVEAAVRDRVMEHLDAFRISLGRANYMQEIERAIGGATEHVVFTSATMATSWSNAHQKRVVDAVLRQVQDHPTYTHRGVVAKRVESLPGTLQLLCETHVDVRMSEIMLMSRLRFVVRDYSISVIGVAEGEPSLEHQPETKRSFSVESTMLAGALRAKFEELWSAASNPWEYLDSMIAAARASHPNYTRAEVFELLGLDMERRNAYSDKMASHCPSFKALPE